MLAQSDVRSHPGIALVRSIITDERYSAALAHMSISPPLLLGHLCYLYCHAYGSMSWQFSSARDVEQHAEWIGLPDKLGNALISVGFLRPTIGGQFILHDVLSNDSESNTPMGLQAHNAAVHISQRISEIFQRYPRALECALIYAVTTTKRLDEIIEHLKTSPAYAVGALCYLYYDAYSRGSREYESSEALEHAARWGGAIGLFTGALRKAEMIRWIAGSFRLRKLKTFDAIDHTSPTQCSSRDQESMRLNDDQFAITNIAHTSSVQKKTLEEIAEIIASFEPNMSLGHAKSEWIKRLKAIWPNGDIASDFATTVLRLVDEANGLRPKSISHPIRYLTTIVRRHEKARRQNHYRPDTTHDDEYIGWID